MMIPPCIWPPSRLCCTCLSQLLAGCLRALLRYLPLHLPVLDRVLLLPDYLRALLGLVGILHQPACSSHELRVNFGDLFPASFVRSVWMARKLFFRSGGRIGVLVYPV